MKIEHNCEVCKNEFLGRCFGAYNFGKDVSMKMDICPCFIDGREPSRVTFDTLGQLENYLREFYYIIDFYTEFTRTQLRHMLMLLYPHTVKENIANAAFSSMCKKRMVKHIEFYIKLHNLKCKVYD